jgi:hypothetical protein
MAIRRAGFKLIRREGGCRRIDLARRPTGLYTFGTRLRIRDGQRGRGEDAVMDMMTMPPKIIRCEQRFPRFGRIVCSSLVLLPAVWAAVVVVWAGPSAASFLLAAVFLACSPVLAYVLDWDCLWVEFDGATLRGQRLLTRRRVEHRVEDLVEIRPGFLGRRPIDLSDYEMRQCVAGYKLRFRTGPSICVMRWEMRNAENLVAAVQQVMRQRSRPDAPHEAASDAGA